MYVSNMRLKLCMRVKLIVIVHLTAPQDVHGRLVQVYLGSNTLELSAKPR